MRHSYHLPGIRAIVDLMYIEVDKSWMVTRVEVGQEHRGQGVGSRLLKMVCEAADEEQAVLTLLACPDETSGLSILTLIEWYIRYGFEVYDQFDDSPFVTMVRFPAKNTRLDSPSED